MNGGNLEKALVYVMAVAVVGLALYVYLGFGKTIDRNDADLRDLSKKLSKVEDSLGIISKFENGGAIKAQSIAVDLGEPININGVRFRLCLTQGLDEEKTPIGLRDSFSLHKDRWMYIYLEWLDLPGDHRVKVRWIMPNQSAYTERIFDTRFEKAVWYTWHWQRLYAKMPQGTWSVEVSIDGNFLITKSFKLMS